MTIMSNKEFTTATSVFGSTFTRYHGWINVGLIDCRLRPDDIIHWAETRNLVSELRMHTPDFMPLLPSADWQTKKEQYQRFLDSIADLAAAILQKDIIDAKAKSEAMAKAWTCFSGR